MPFPPQGNIRRAGVFKIKIGLLLQPSHPIDFKTNTSLKRKKKKKGLRVSSDLKSFLEICTFGTGAYFFLYRLSERKKDGVFLLI